MPVFDAAALNDNDENLAFLRAVLARPAADPRARCGRPAGHVRWRAVPAPGRTGRAGLPLIVGVAVAITTGAAPRTRH